MTDDEPSAQLGDTVMPTSDIRVFLLAEVRDFTRFSQERGDEDATRLVQRFAALAREVLESRGGKVLEFRGDEALAVFGGARQALRAAVELQARYVEETERNPAIPLRVGIGLDAGEAIPFEGGFRGRALNLAARLKDQARAGQVLATEALIHLAGNTEGLKYFELGVIHPKGLDVPVHVVEVAVEGQEQLRTTSAPEPELRTFLFTDIANYFTFANQHDDTETIDLQNWYSSFATEHVRARGGRVVEVAGDSAIAVFVSPRHAIYAALDLQEHFQQAIEANFGLSLRLKIGLETGEAIPYRGRYTGRTVHLAVRACEAAEPGEVLIGGTLAQLVNRMSDIRLVECGHVEVKGYDDPLKLLQVLRKQDSGADESII